MEALCRGQGVPFPSWLVLSPLYPRAEESVSVTVTPRWLSESGGAFLIGILLSPPLPALGKALRCPKPFLSVSAAPAPLAGGVQMLSRA